jgi:hypothetical protein
MSLRAAEGSMYSKPSTYTFGIGFNMFFTRGLFVNYVQYLNVEATSNL